MVKLTWFNSLSKEEIQNVVASVDTVLFDIDGVLMLNKSLIPGAVDAVAKLRKLGKKIAFVTNNGGYPLESIQINLKMFEAKREEILTPNHALLAYLKKTNFKKDIYVIGTYALKQLIRDAGYNVVDYFKDIKSTKIEETMSAIKKTSLEALDICKNVGIIYIDFDANVNFGALQVAQIILNNDNDVKFVSGSNDEALPMGNELIMFGSKFYIEAVETLTKRKSLKMAKPSQQLTNTLISRFKISDPSRVLMVGDNPHTDIVFGVKGGFKTCLVLSGAWRKDQAENWNELDEFTPDYIADSLGELYASIKDM